MTMPLAQVEPDVGDEPGIHEYLWLIWARRGSILAVVAIFMGVMLFKVSEQPKVYLAITEVLINPFSKQPGAVEPSEEVANLEPARRMASSADVKRLVEERIGPIDDSTVIAVQAPGGNALVFYVNAHSPVVAQRTSQAYADVFLAFRSQQLLEDVQDALAPIDQRVNELNRQIGEIQTGLAVATEPERTSVLTGLNSLLAQRQALEQQRNALKISHGRAVGRVLQPAKLPTEKISPHRLKTGVTSLFFGLVLGIGQAMARSMVVPRVQGSRDVARELRAPVLARLPLLRRRRRTTTSPWFPTAQEVEDYAGVRAAIVSERRGGKPSTVLVTSPEGGEGSSRTATHVAVSLARDGQTVVLVRQGEPAAHDHDNLMPTLSDRLRVVDVDRNGSSKGLAPDALGTTLKTLQGQADLVVIDSPPVLKTASTLTIAPLADMVLVTAVADRTTCAALREARLRLDQVGATIIGAVLTDVTPARSFYEQRIDRGR
jgi:Mrp family chromosome partitioning ATPase